MGSTFERNHKVAYGETSKNGEVFVSEIVNYMVETSINHGENLGIGVDYQKSKGEAWILYRWDITFNEMPRFYEDLKVTTECMGANKFYAYRKFNIYRNEQCLIDAKSQWVYLDFNKRKVKRITEKDIEKFDVKGKETLSFDKLLKEKEEITSRLFTVRYRDIDMNEHVNNTKYVCWAIESIDHEFLINHKIKNLKVIYKKETTYKDVVTSKVYSTKEDNVLLHKIYSSEGVELAVLQSTWDAR
ncbi:acyl-ACP thioesterase domain-containing protein [uncultured Clostridium sp.]|uniref:acyl-[acyl-carrier-protein] thioesterase n=1 Tax=uncultured Clostridium sp. TaxID=59620 RepID=UPI0025EC3BC2|nr:acyl-ACP thioesterase domain-containing protein [uncultured Clostridium sp.]